MDVDHNKQTWMYFNFTIGIVFGLVQSIKDANIQLPTPEFHIEGEESHQLSKIVVKCNFF
jgi:hypothetical protein